MHWLYEIFPVIYVRIFNTYKARAGFEPQIANVLLMRDVACIVLKGHEEAEQLVLRRVLEGDRF